MNLIKKISFGIYLGLTALALAVAAQSLAYAIDVAPSVILFPMNHWHRHPNGHEYLFSWNEQLTLGWLIFTAAAITLTVVFAKEHRRKNAATSR